MNKVVVLFSGGMDSATLLTSLREEGNEVFALGVNYNQKHRTELEYAQRFCAKMGIDYRIVDLSCLSYFLCGSSQTEPGIAVPEGHYEDESMKLTVVPNRNMILLSVAIGWAISLGAKQVAYAAHAGDHAIYPDCRKEFIEAFAVAARLCHYENGIELIAPFSRMTKANIATVGGYLRVPYELTWSCYNGREKHCGRCGTCTERKEAFQLAELPDPTEYEEYVMV